MEVSTDYPFELNTVNVPLDVEIDPEKGRNIVVHWIKFVDRNKQEVEPTGGTVDISMSAGGGAFLSMLKGNFNAIRASDSDREQPNALGRCQTVRIVTEGVTDAAGFQGLIEQFRV